MIDTKGYVSVAEAAQRLRLSSEQVRRRLRCGTLEGQRVGNQWFVDQAALRNGENKAFKPLIPPEMLDDIKRLRREIKQYNGGKELDVVEMLRESRESR